MQRNSLHLFGIALLFVAVLGCGLRRGRTYHSNPFSSAPSAQAPRTEPAKKAQPDLLSEVPAADPHFEPANSVQQTEYATTDRSVITADWEGDGQPQGPVVVAESTRPAATPGLMQRPDIASTPAHATDYSWVQGHLEYSALGGGVWKVRYAPISQDDPHGGSVILDIDPTERDIHAGDLVWVQGQIAPNMQRGSLPNPVYHVIQLQSVD